MNPITNNINGTAPLAARLESYAAPRREVQGEGSLIQPSGGDRADRVELSAQARSLASSPTPIRQELVNRVRAEIEAGTYDIESKLDKAVTELAKDLNPLDNLYA